MKLSLITKNKPVTLETPEGDIELVITKFTGHDAQRRANLISEYFEDTNLSNIEKYNGIQIARLMSSLKYADGLDYFLNGSVKDFLGLDYPEEITNALVNEVDKLNPQPALEADEKKPLDSKKKKS